MNVNKQVIASTLVIMAVGIVHAWTAKPPQGITSVVMGGYGVMLVLAVIDLFGGGMQRLASALSLLAVVFVLLLEGLPIIQGIGGGTSTGGASTGGTTPTGGTNPAAGGGGHGPVEGTR